MYRFGRSAPAVSLFRASAVSAARALRACKIANAYIIADTIQSEMSYLTLVRSLGVSSGFSGPSFAEKLYYLVV